MRMVKNDIWPYIRGSAPALLAIGLLVSPGLCRAANHCPWINEATVSGLLGGEAAGVNTDANAGGVAKCEFTQQSESYQRTLRVTVEVTADAQAKLEELARGCGRDIFALKAIGNDALACTAIDLKSGQGERAIGRVRDRIFTIAIYTSRKNDPILTRETLKVRINTAAELVAGNLF